MEFVCRQCEGNAFLLLPEEAGTVTAECLGCGTSTLIEIPATPRSSGHSRYRRALRLSFSASP